jgi:hypothetical protein
MTDAEFFNLLDLRTKKMKFILASKAKEYARGDRMHNFKCGALPLKCTPERFLVFLWMKHVVSILDMVNDLDSGNINTVKLWNEKLTDGINYLALLEGLIMERFPRELRKITRMNLLGLQKNKDK